MVGGFAALILCQLAGLWLAEAFALPIPGPVLGIILLFTGLSIKGSAWPGLEKLSGFLLRHLSLFFVPAAVGLILYGKVLQEHWLAIILAILISTPIAIGVSALVYKALDRK